MISAFRETSHRVPGRRHCRPGTGVDREREPGTVASGLRFSHLGLLVLLTCSATSCRDSAPEGTTQESPRVMPTVASSPIAFRDITQDSAVRSTYRNGREAGRYAILESLGGGTGAFDFDRDGLVDLFFTGGGGFRAQAVFGYPSLLYRNRDGEHFEDVTGAALLDDPHTYTQGCSMGDYDCDGFQDVLVTGYGGLQLLHNLGDGTFEELTAAAGLTDRLWSSSAAWGDLNGDGWPDLYIAHYVDWSFENDPVCPSPWPEHERDVCPPRAFQGLPDTVYFNQGDGRFIDASADARLRDDGKGLGVILADLDHDADLDVYVANDMVDNFLYQNDGTGRFEEVGLISGTASDFEGRPNGSMGLAVCDYNGDLTPDLWVTNFEQETFALYRNDGTGNFVHASREAGITALGSLFVGFGTAMGDLDCDGDEDAVITNGHVIYYPSVSTERQVPVLLENIGAGKFVPVESAGGTYFSQPHLGRGLAIADLNNDGRLDFVAGHSNEPAAVLLNTTSPVGRWVRLQLVGRRSSRDAVGAHVVFHTRSQDQLRHVAGGGSFESHNDTRVHLGIGDLSEPVTATVYWPSGSVQQVSNLPPLSTTFIVEE